MAEVLRAARYLNVLLGGWIPLAPWVLAGATHGSRWHDLGAGVLLVLLGLPRGPVRERFGSWQRYIV
jgi:SPW repeat